jgi:hypothetical protein
VTGRLLRYTRIGNRELLDGELWVAITSGSPGKGGGGIILKGRLNTLKNPHGRRLEPKLGPGDPFQFAANKDYDENGTVGGKAVREMWGLDAVPDDVAALWMRLKHTGKLHA